MNIEDTILLSFIPINEMSESIFKNFFTPILIFDVRNLNIIKANNAAIETFCYSEKEILQLKIADLKEAFEANDLDKLSGTSVKPLPQIRKYRTKYNTELLKYEHVYSIKFNNVDASLLFLVDYYPQSASNSVSLDASKSLFAHSQQAAKILDSLDEYIWSRRVDNNEVIYSNNACKKVFGYHEKEMYKDGHNLFSEIVHPEDIARVLINKHSTVNSEKNKIEHDFRVFHRDGSLRNINSTIIFNKGLNGFPDTILGVTKDITKFVTAEKKYQEKAIELTNILNSINDCYFTLDTKFCYTYANDAYLKMINLEYEAIINKCIWDVFPYLKDFRLYHEYHNVINHKVAASFEEYSPVLDIWMDIRAYPNPSGMTVCLTNFTEQRKLTQRLIESERNIKALIDNTSDYLLSVDRNLNIISINQPLKNLKHRMTGIEPVIGGKLVPDDFGNPIIRDYWNDLFRRGLKGEIFTDLAERNFGGKTIFLESSLNPIINNDEIVGVSCFTKDVTKQIQLNNKIKESEDNLSALINNTDDRIISLNNELNLITCNNAFRKFIYEQLGQKVEIGDDARNLKLPHEFLNKWNVYIQRAISGESFTIREQSINKNQDRIAESKFAPIISYTGDVIGVTVYIRDVTDEILYLERIKNQNDKLREIAWIQSHQVRSKVATILGLGQLIEPNDFTDENSKFAISGILQMTNDLDVLIREINEKTTSIEE